MTLSLDPALAQLSPAELARAERRGELVRLRRGSYLRAADLPSDPADRHRRLVAATWPLLGEGAVLSHCSAAALHGLPLWTAPFGKVQLTRTSGRGKCRGEVHVHVAPLTSLEVVVLGGTPVTSLARTVVDLGRTLPLVDAVAAGDAALRVGLSREELGWVLDQARGRPGVEAARRAVAALDPRSESAGESASRVVLHRIGLPPSDLQFEVLDELGRFVARCDFVWEQQRTLGEFDGRVKYERLLRPGQSAAQVVYAEKRREDAARDLDWQMVRWSAPDLLEEQVLADRLRRAFRRGRS